MGNLKLSSVKNCINHNNIKTKKISFIIEEEEDIAEFWEYCTFDSKSVDFISECTIKVFYHIAVYALKKNINPEIWIECSNDFTYITILNIYKIDKKVIEKFISCDINYSPYKISFDKLSVAVSKICQINEQKQPPKELEIACNILEAPKKRALSNTFMYIESDDLIDIKDYVVRLSSLLLIVSNGDIEIEEIEEIAVYLEKISKVACMYSASFSIGMALLDFSKKIFQNIETFQKKSADLGPLCLAFSKDMQEWIRLVFVDGTENINCMDETIIFNAMTLGNIVSGTNISSQTDDDIFNF